MFDEPVNGLDPEGIRWIRLLMRSLAAEGRTVFVSSHLMSEMENTADHLIVIGRGKLIADCPMAEFVADATAQAAVVKTPDGQLLAEAVVAAGGTDGTGRGRRAHRARPVRGARRGTVARSRHPAALPGPGGCRWRRHSWN